jgi:hypothetical protein
MTEIVTTTNKVSGFDYAALPADTTEILQSTVLRIKDRMQANIIDTGRDLRKIKDEVLDHGEFGRWLKTELGLTERTAQNYMRAAELAAEYEIVSLLPATSLYRLASPSTPDTVRVAIVERLDKGETISARDISDSIAQAKWEQAEADRIARIPPAKLKRERLRKERRKQEAEARWLELEAREREERAAAHRAIAILQGHLSTDQLKEFWAEFNASSFEFRSELEKKIRSGGVVH